jgi:Mlc titration factor MtfA (ptsG expression regulator)
VRAYDDFVDALDAVEAIIPADVDPESAQANAWYAELPLDPYAATDLSEFFAVAAESFFVDAERLESEFPDLFAAFVEYFGQDPRSRGSHPKGRSVT